MRNPCPITLPRWQSHKQVSAVKIREIRQIQDGNAALIIPENPGVDPIEVSHDFLCRHDPKAGGYFVIYDGDGYQSYSPAEPFEAGYTLIR